MSSAGSSMFIRALRHCVCVRHSFCHITWILQNKAKASCAYCSQLAAKFNLPALFQVNAVPVCYQHEDTMDLALSLASLMQFS